MPAPKKNLTDPPRITFNYDRLREIMYAKGYNPRSFSEAFADKGAKNYYAVLSEMESKQSNMLGKPLPILFDLLDMTEQEFFSLFLFKPKRKTYTRKP